MHISCYCAHCLTFCKGIGVIQQENQLIDTQPDSKVLMLTRKTNLLKTFFSIILFNGVLPLPFFFVSCERIFVCESTFIKETIDPFLM
jgi:hypothetical protein